MVLVESGPVVEASSCCIVVGDEGIWWLKGQAVATESGVTSQLCVVVQE